MWTTENRHRYDRDKLRYPSDLTDAEWQLIEPLIPPAKRGSARSRRAWITTDDRNGKRIRIKSGPGPAARQRGGCGHSRPCAGHGHPVVSCLARHMGQVV